MMQVQCMPVLDYLKDIDLITQLQLEISPDNPNCETASTFDTNLQSIRDSSDELLCSNLSRNKLE
jgi:hypothetical protein